MVAMIYLQYNCVIQSASLHCCQILPCAKLLRSSLVGLSQITATLFGLHKPVRDQGGTQNNSSDDPLIIHPFSMRESVLNPLHEPWELSEKCVNLNEVEMIHYSLRSRS
jgi:hypothetical protein